ncbi:MAG: hypothetical protein IKH19_01590 [Muribaculaceae bacterium]|nr:hypothetical protein [Muribaculaceae bacterium]
MFKLLLLILLFVILYPIIKGWMAIRRMHRSVRDAFDAARQVDESVEDGQRKVFSEDDGVYADYEEVRVPRTESPEQEKSSQSGTESQIIDADYEEIP